jgi:hypothetical protein
LTTWDFFGCPGVRFGALHAIFFLETGLVAIIQPVKNNVEVR